MFNLWYGRDIFIHSSSRNRARRRQLSLDAESARLKCHSSLVDDRMCDAYSSFERFSSSSSTYSDMSACGLIVKKAISV